MSRKCEKNSHKEKFESLDKLKVRDLCVKNLKAVDITTKTITGVTGTFDNLTVNNATLKNLNVTNINGRDLKCDNAPFNFSGVITPVAYLNGVPQQPANPGNFNQAVLDDLWRLNVLVNGFSTLDAASGRLRNTILNNFYGCEICPPVNLSGCTGATGPARCSNQGYSVFTGSISKGSIGATGTILTVTSLSNESLTNCPPEIRPIQIGQMLFVQDSAFPSSTIVSQLSGTPGGVGTYLISNNFNNYSVSVSSQRMLSLSNLTINDCVSVPLKIYGVETLTVGPTGPCGNIISQIAYNINVANKTLNTRIAAIYTQVGWQVPGATGPTSVNVQGLSVDTRQFDPSILSFGEQMNNNVLLPTNLINSIANYNRLSNLVNAVVQLVVYVEDGLEVLIPESGSATPSSSIALSREVSVNSIRGSDTNFSTSYTSPSCSLISSQGSVSSYIQPDIGQTVTVNTFEFYLSSDFLKGYPLITTGGAYVINNVTGSPNLPTLELIYLGLPGLSYSTIPPGQQVPQTPQNAVTENFISHLIGTYIQPGVGQTVTISITFPCPSIVFPGNPTPIIYIRDFTNYKIGSIYDIVSISSIENREQIDITLRNTGNVINAPPGSVIGIKDPDILNNGSIFVISYTF